MLGNRAPGAVRDRFGPQAVLCRPEPPRGKDPDMPILIFLILVILIAQVGFWDTFTAILGGVAMIVLFVLLAIALVVLAGILLVRRLRRRGQSLP